MKAVYENDTVRGAGYGLFRLEETGAVAEGAQYGLVRSGDHKSLHPHGWEETECRLVPDSSKVEGSALYLSVGPGIVNRLDALNTYRFLLYPASGAAQKAVLELTHIVYAPEADAGNVVGGVQQAAAVPAAPVPEPEPVAVQAPVPPLEMATPAAPAPITPPRRSGLPPWALALIALLVIGWWVGVGAVVKEKFFPSTEVVEEVTPETPVAESPATPQPETPPASSAQTSPSVLSPLDQARMFLRGSGSGDEAFTLASQLPETPEGRDAAFLLMEYAAEKGQGEAMLTLAGLYDPSREAARGSIVPDAEQAWYWYGKAEQAGKAKSAEHRAALKAWLEAEAAKGSAAARESLLRLQ